MSTAAYSSTAWRRRVIGMPKADLSPDRKLALLALETFADYQDGTNARPGVQLLADMCNLTTRAVRDALTCGRDLGLIKRTELANRRRGKSDVYRLLSTGTVVPLERAFTGTVVPPDPDFWGNGHVESGGTAAPILGERPFPPPVQDQDKTEEGEPQSVKSPVPGPDAPTRNRSANSKAATPSRSPSQTAPAAAAPPPTDDELARAAKLPDTHPDDRPPFSEPEPSKYCPDHPDDTDDACPTCQRTRKAHPEAHKAWQNRREADVTTAAKNRKAWRHECQECDEAGWEKNADGVVPADEARRCFHPRLRAARAVRQTKYTTPKPGKAAAS